MAFRRRRSTFRSSTSSLGWISWNRSGKGGTLGLGRCLRHLRGFHILGRAALETLPDCLVEKHVPGRAVQAATSDVNRNGKGSRPLFTRRRRCGISAVPTRHKRFQNSTARISPRTPFSPGMMAVSPVDVTLTISSSGLSECEGLFSSTGCQISRSPVMPARDAFSGFHSSSVHDW